MKKFKLNLEKYDVTVKDYDRTDDGKVKIVDGAAIPTQKQVEYPLKDNLTGWLRSVGVFRCVEDVAEAIVLAKSINDCTEDTLVLDERQAKLLKAAVNKQLEATADGKSTLGGMVHEEVIIRVANMEQIN